MLALLDASPFAGTASYYHRFRAPYAQAAIDFIVERYNLGKGVRALDLGCGPGTIAIRLSHSVREVVAVDSDADMIAEGQRFGRITRPTEHPVATVQGRRHFARDGAVSSHYNRTSLSLDGP